MQVEALKSFAYPTIASLFGYIYQVYKKVILLFLK